MEITNNEDTLDSRDIIERIEELESNLDTCPHCGESMDIEKSEKINKCPDCEQILLEDNEKEEFEALKKLEDEASGSPDWEYGEILIRESYFTEYCKELCQDIGDMPKELPWYIANHIDWEGVAREIKQDYMEVDFDGVSYFIRA